MQQEHRVISTRTKKLLYPKEMQPLFQIDQDSLLMGRELVRFGWNQPPLDLYETETELVARLDMPGIEEEDIQIELGEDAIRVNAEKKTSTLAYGVGFGKIERTYKGYYRIISLPQTIDPDRTTQCYKNGVLEIRMPKMDER